MLGIDGLGRAVGGLTCERVVEPPVAEVMRTSAAASRMRAAKLSALKPQNTTLWTAPMRAHASTATASSGTIGKYRQTRSPGRTPSARSRLAKRHTSACSSR